MQAERGLESQRQQRFRDGTRGEPEQRFSDICPMVTCMRCVPRTSAGRNKHRGNRRHRRGGQVVAVFGRPHGPNELMGGRRIRSPFLWAPGGSPPAEWTHCNPVRFPVGGPGRSAGSSHRPQAKPEAAGLSSHACRRPLGPNVVGATRCVDLAPAEQRWAPVSGHLLSMNNSEVYTPCRYMCPNITQVPTCVSILKSTARDPCKRKCNVCVWGGAPAVSSSGGR